MTERPSSLRQMHASIEVLDAWRIFLSNPQRPLEPATGATHVCGERIRAARLRELCSLVALPLGAVLP